MEFSLKEIIQLAVQGGVGVILLIVWYYTRQDGNKRAEDARKQTDSAIEVAQKAVESANSISKEAFQKHAILTEALFQHMRDEQAERAVMTGVMDRLTIRLETPISCPMALAGRKFRVEVDDK